MESLQEFNLNEALNVRGTKNNGFIKIAVKPDGSWVRIPVMVVCGVQDGPLFLVDCCHHGDEYEGTEAIIAVAKALNPDKLKGTFVGVPAVNLDAFAFGQRVSPVDWSHQDLNRAYPGKDDSFITGRIAKYYMDNLVRKADYIITFHGGGDYLCIESLAAYQSLVNESGKMSYEMAKAFGVEILWGLKDLPFGGTLRIEAEKMGIPAITVEIGGQSVRHPHRRKYVETATRGITNVMAFLGMLDGTIINSENKINVEWINYIHTNAGGIHLPLKYPKEMVKEGEILSRITDIFGDTVGEVKAPFDGMVVGYWSYPVIQPGSWSYMFGRIS